MSHDARVPGPEPLAATSLRDHLRAHAGPLTGVAFASILGVAASFVFQIVSARYLAPADFGLLAAFFVIVNVAAVGSSALQNIVVVQTASVVDATTDRARTRRWPVEALILGIGGAVAVCVASPWIAASLDTTPGVVIVGAATIPLSFVFADALGLLQGTGRIASAVWWSTQAQLARVVLVVLVVAIGAGLAGVLGSVLAATAVAVAGALWSARGIRRPARGIFTLTGLSILVLTVAFTWLTSSDVLFLRASAADDVAGTYASVIVLVKGAFLLPATLSLYLLPRFVRHRDNPTLTRVGVFATLAVSIATSLLMVIGFALVGGWLIPLLFGSAYEAAVPLLVPITLAYLPWMAAQGMLIKMTSSASPVAAGFLVIAVIAQSVVFALVVPDIQALLVSLAVIGTAVLAVFLVIDLRGDRQATGDHSAARA